MMDVDDYRAISGMKVRQGKPKYPAENLLQCHFAHYTSHMT
jgi:hypothetical protein